jgi:hypothetical protein
MPSKLDGPDPRASSAARREPGASAFDPNAVLDRDRVASMADEGGVSGAYMDSCEQCAELDRPESRFDAGRWLVWGSITACAAALFVAAFGELRRRIQSA